MHLRRASLHTIMEPVLQIFFIFLTSCVANLATDESVGQAEIRNIFGKLFNAAVASKYKEMGHYAEILQSEKLKHEKVFGEWEEETKNARSKNLLNTQNIHSSVQGNVFKREETRFEPLHNRTVKESRKTYAYFVALEDQFINHFGDDPKNITRWEAAKNWFLEEGEPTLMKFCAEAHRLAGNGVYTIDHVFLESRLVEFRTEEYLRRLLDVVSYTVKIPGTISDPLDVFLTPQTYGSFYLAEGLKPDCVFFLKFDSKSRLLLEDHICGITIESKP